jgi:hypothetical protein
MWRMDSLSVGIKAGATNGCVPYTTTPEWSRRTGRHSSGLPGCSTSPARLISAFITTTRSAHGGDVHAIEVRESELLGASAVQNNNHCLQQEVNVEPDGPVSNIEEILRLLNLQIAVAPR